MLVIENSNIQSVFFAIFQDTFLVIHHQETIIVYE